MDEDEKRDDVAIVQFTTEPYTWYESNGSVYKTERNGFKIFGLGNDGNIYRYGKHTLYRNKTYIDFIGWRKFIPTV